MKRFKPKTTIPRAILFNSVLIFITAILVFYAEVLGYNNKFMFVVILTILDCIVIAMMMPTHMLISIIFHKNVPDNLKGRVLSVQRMLSLISVPLGQLFYGFLVDTAPVYVAVIIGALAMFICGLLYKYSFNNLAD